MFRTFIGQYPAWKFEETASGFCTISSENTTSRGTLDSQSGQTAEGLNRKTAGNVVSQLEQELCPTCKSGERVSSSMRSEGDTTIEEIMYSCGHKRINLTIEEKISCSVTIRLKSKSKEKLRTKPTKELRHVTKSDGYQLRYVKTRSENETHVLQLGWKNSEIDTVHCKTCGNDWKKTCGQKLSAQFDVEEVRKGVLRIKCKKCGREAMSG
jgi:hypothetical protein